VLVITILIKIVAFWTFVFLVDIWLFAITCRLLWHTIEFVLLLLLLFVLFLLLLLSLTCIRQIAQFT